MFGHLTERCSTSSRHDAARSRLFRQKQPKDKTNLKIKLPSKQFHETNLFLPRLYPGRHIPLCHAIDRGAASAASVDKRVPCTLVSRPRARRCTVVCQAVDRGAAAQLRFRWSLPVSAAAFDEHQRTTYDLNRWL
jgi:hypothetical protein